MKEKKKNNYSVIQQSNCGVGDEFLKPVAAQNNIMDATLQ